jgi:hypothetical protein
MEQKKEVSKTEVILTEIQVQKESEELEKLYYSYPDEIINMVANGKMKGFLLHGKTSLGKSYQVKRILKKLGKKPVDKKGIGDYVFISGHITPMKFYNKKLEFKDKLIIFDDVDILRNPIIINMIKAGLNENSGNVVEYHTTRNLEIPSSFVFTGQMIILANEIPKENEHIKAIMSRIPHYELKFDREQMLNILKGIAYQDINGITLEERLEIVDFIKINTSLATTNLNIRLFLQSTKFYKWNKEKWKEMTLGQIQTDERIDLILKGCSEKDFCEKMGCHRATYYRIKRNILNATATSNATSNYALLTSKKINPGVIEEKSHFLTNM